MKYYQEDTMLKKSVLLIAVLALIISCSGPSRQVSRVGVDTTIDLSGRWNDADARMVSEKIVDDVLDANWLFSWMGDNQEKPIVIVGTIGNKTSEHINTETFSADIERELVNSGKVRFVAAKKQRDEIRDERLDQQSQASEETSKRLAQELGADFMLQGTLSSIEDAIDGKKVVYYQADMNLVNLETNEIVWMGSKKIKKFVAQSKLKW
ncbi:MAG: penicillin-binding protein activator LpoB [Candidatus Cloacimonetes bacterium]|nr:penicillin-binding protein activator LpoB [Candidatus Cloacimonadota bacterium]